MEDIELYDLLNGELPRTLEQALTKFKGELNHLNTKDRIIVLNIITETFLSGINFALDISKKLLN